MRLQHFIASSRLTLSVALQEEKPKNIILRSKSLTVTASPPSEDDELLGLLTLRSGNVKLEAVKQLFVQSDHPLLSSKDKLIADPHVNAYQLEPAFEGRVEILILRHGDLITSPNSHDTLSCVPQASEVQVNSSAAEVGQAAASKALQNGKESLDDETEDEAISDNTVTEVPRTQPVTQQIRTQPSATPQLATHQSIVQETPTIDRMMPVAKNEHSNAAALSEPPALVVTETFSTARTGRSPKSTAQDSLNDPDGKRPHSSPEVRIDRRRTRKRPSADPASDIEAVLSAESPSAKRIKTDAPIEDDEESIDQASPLDQINSNPTRTTYSARLKKRPKATEEATPTKSTRSSQRSETAAVYEGDPPRVATSNSTISESSSAVRFLKKHGGALLSSVEDKCNVLCVRDGGLMKTMKVFQAIALGVPIVTDRWLLDSAKKGEFLDLVAYKPSLAQQEKDWNYDLDTVWGVVQTPFKGYSIYFTPALKRTYSNFREIERVCHTVGAKIVAKHTGKHENVIVLATEDEDPDAEKLIENGEMCFHKDLLTMSILRGSVDLVSNEFKIRQQNTGETRKRAPRKST